MEARFSAKVFVRNQRHQERSSRQVGSRDPVLRGWEGFAEFQHPRILANEVTGLDGVVDTIVFADQHPCRLSEPPIAVARISPVDRRLPLRPRVEWQPNGLEEVAGLDHRQQLGRT
jgi:hypothetical protein